MTTAIGKGGSGHHHGGGGRGRGRRGWGWGYPYPYPDCDDDYNLCVNGNKKATKNMSASDDEMGSVGFDDIVGETQEIVGDIAIGELLNHAADEMISGNPQTALAELAVARKAVPNAIAVFQRKLRSRRRQPLGFESATIPIAATDVVVTAAPQQLFRAKRMVIASPVAVNISIVDVKVGNKSQLVGTEDPITGAMFSELAVGTFVDFLTANVGNKVGVLLRNVSSTVTVTTVVTMIGVVAEP